MPKGIKTGIPYISAKDFFNTEEIDFENAKKISASDFVEISQKIKPEANDILFSRYGSIGEIRLVKIQEKFLASYSIAVLKTINISTLILYQYYGLISPFLKQQMNKEARATTQYNLGLDQIKGMCIPIPPETEMCLIVELIEKLNSIIDKEEKYIEKNLEKLSSFRQSLLHYAFISKLVPQDPSNEPASMLLERIKSSRGV